MRKVSLVIDDKEVVARRGDTLLQAARHAGINIPTLCYHEKLTPQAACRLCMVEIGKGAKSRIVASCVYPVEPGLVVSTRSEPVIRVRRLLLELLLPLAPNARILRDLAQEYGVTGGRFSGAEPSFCTLCGLCVRYCAEVKKAHAIGFVGRGVERRVVFYPEIASHICMSCRECFPLCPTAKLASETDGVCFLDFSIDDYLAGKIA